MGLLDERAGFHPTRGPQPEFVEINRQVMMDEFQAELKTIVRDENILALQLADMVENLTGFELGTVENAEEVVTQLELRVEQTIAAIDLLDEELHIIPVTALRNLNEGYHLPALRNAQKRLEQINQKDF